MGNLFGGGGGGGDQQGGYLPNPSFNIPGEASLLPSAQFRSQSALPWTTLGQRTIDFGHGEYNPQTMGAQLPTFQPMAPQQNPWMQQKQMPMGGFAYQPPVNNVGFNPFMMATPFNQIQQGSQSQQQQPQGQPTGQQSRQPQQGGTA